MAVVASINWAFSLRPSLTLGLLISRSLHHSFLRSHCCPYLQLCKLLKVTKLLRMGQDLSIWQTPEPAGRDRVLDPMSQTSSQEPSSLAEIGNQSQLLISMACPVLPAMLASLPWHKRAVHLDITLVAVTRACEHPPTSCDVHLLSLVSPAFLRLSCKPLMCSLFLSRIPV